MICLASVREMPRLSANPKAPAIDDAEVDTFGFIAHFLRDFGLRNIVHPCRSSRRNVRSLPESAAHVFILTDRGYNAQLDLGIVGRKKDVLLSRGTKAFRISFRGPVSRDILQIGIIALQAASYGNRLARRKPCTLPVLGLIIREGVNVGGFQFGQLAVCGISSTMAYCPLAASLSKIIFTGLVLPGLGFWQRVRQVYQTTLRPADG